MRAEGPARATKPIFGNSLGPRLYSRDLRFDLFDSVSHHAVDDSAWDCESVEY